MERNLTRTLKEALASGDKLGLEDIVRLANKIGLEYADAKKDWIFLS